MGKDQISKFDIAKNTNTGELVIVPHQKGNSSPPQGTGMTMEQAAEAYPRASANNRGKRGSGGSDDD